MSADDPATEENIEVVRTLWEPHPAQKAIMEHPARFRVVAAGRRFGKSVMAAHLALEYALEHPNAVVWWVAPTYDQANSYGFDKIKPLASPDVLAEEPKRTKPRRFAFDNGSVISFRSAEREDSLRGPGIDFLVVDEAGSVPERAFTEELRPALSDTLGEAVIIGTPRGRNWFYRWFQRGKSPDHDDTVAFQAPTEANPHVPNSEIEDAKSDMSERRHRQEYGAEFIDDTGGVFEAVRDRVEEYDLPVDPDPSTAYAVGADLARFEDYTAIVVLDGDGRLVAFDRLQEVTWTRIQTRIEEFAERYAPAAVSIDATRDNKLVSDLEQSGVSVTPVNFTSKKEPMIENLVARLESDEITLSTDAPTLINELEVFEYETTSRGTVTYSAPSGFHDDAVDALALASHVLPRVRRVASKRGDDDENGRSGTSGNNSNGLKLR